MGEHMTDAELATIEQAMQGRTKYVGRQQPHDERLLAEVHALRQMVRDYRALVEDVFRVGRASRRDTTDAQAWADSGVPDRLARLDPDWQQWHFQPFRAATTGQCGICNKGVE